MGNELAALGRSGGLFDHSQALTVGSSVDGAWAYCGEAGLSVLREGQRTAWFDLPRAGGGIGVILDREHLTGRVAAVLDLLAAVDLPVPDMVAPAVALGRLAFLHIGRVGDNPFSFGSSSLDQVRPVPDETVRFADLTAHAVDVADELVARLVNSLR